MGLEEQTEEREVLESIFPDEITDVSSTSYRVAIALDVDDPHAHTDIDNQDQRKPTLLLNVSYPSTYPDVGPDLDLSNAPDAPRHPLLDVANDKARLLEGLDPTIEESLGMAMVFTLVTTLKEAAENLIADRRRAAQQVKDKESAKAEEEENRKFHGTSVTRERFSAWRTGFRKEMEEREKREKEEAEVEEKKKGGRVKVEEKKMSGRQLWEKGLAGKVDEADVGVDGADDSAIMLVMDKLKVTG